MKRTAAALSENAGLSTPTEKVGEASAAQSAAIEQLRDNDPGRAQIIEAAADCFMEAGYNATSIDDVARRLSSTKGRIYHYYRAKADLFFDVHRTGMSINLDAIRPIAAGHGRPVERLAAMCRAHVLNMLDWINFQRVVMQGVEMHLAGATTPAQRQRLQLLMAEREAYENLFRQVLLEAHSAGEVRFDNPSFASKAVLAVLNNPVLWYRRRKGESETERTAIADAFTHHALGTVGAGAYFDATSGEKHV